MNLITNPTPLDELSAQLAAEILPMLGRLLSNAAGEIDPPDEVEELAAQAAASVIVAFESGRRANGKSLGASMNARLLTSAGIGEKGIAAFDIGWRQDNPNSPDFTIGGWPIK